MNGPMYARFREDIKARLRLGVDEDGYVHEFEDATRNTPIEDVAVCHTHRFVSFIGSDGDENVVVRVPFEILHALGCTDESILASMDQGPDVEVGGS